MISFKFIFESVVEQGRRAIKLAARPKINNTGNCRQLKLSELSTKESGGRVGNKLGQQNQLSDIKAASCSASNVSLVSVGEGGLFKFLRPVTSRLFQGIVRKVPTPLWAEARKRSAKRLFGQTAPFFALVGVTLVSGPERGLLTAQDELEALCGDIREAISRAGWIHNPGYWRHLYNQSAKETESSSSIPEHGYSLKDFVLGSVIDKGCNAVVYAAKWNKVAEEATSEPVAKTGLGDERTNTSCESITLLNRDLWSLDQFNSSLPNINSNSPVDVHDNDNEDASTTDDNDDFDLDGQSSTEKKTNISSPLTNSEIISLQKLNLPSTFSSQKLPQDTDLHKSMDILLSTGAFTKPCKRKKVKFKDVPKDDCESEGAIASPYYQFQKMPLNSEVDSSCSSQEYPMAVKMMFNYEAESNAPAILSAMYKELIPARTVQLNENLLLWKQRFLSDKVHLPPHANIVEMPCVFVDRIPLLEGGLNLYPDALPKRINPSGYGRNMSLFCVMKRYDCTLFEYVSRYEPSIRTSLLLLTQLLEAINHINKYGVSHRDLKSDNILLSLCDGIDSPLLVLSDFGCCLTEPNLKVPFLSYEADPRHGNTSLMAPEVKEATPGLLSSINYARADLWAAGTIAFEIFGLENPFIPGNKMALDSSTYRDSQIPRLPKKIPSAVRHLIYEMLRKNPKQRPSPLIAVNICQLSLWGPSKWLIRHALTYPSHSEVTRWLLCLSTKVLCEAGSALPSARSYVSSSNSMGASCASNTCSLEPSSQPPSESVGKGSGGGYLEYEIVSTFLSRIHYADIIQALKWNRAF